MYRDPLYQVNGLLIIGLARLPLVRWLLAATVKGLSGELR
jgi:hypothetical protein